MKFFRLLRIFIFSAALTAVSLCAAPNNGTVVTAQNSSQLEQERYKDKNFYILDISEMTIDGASTLVITFSTPLAGSKNLDSFINVQNTNKSKKADGSWELSKNKLEIYFKYLEPNTRYDVFIGKTSIPKIKNIAGKSLEWEGDYSTYITTKDIRPSVGFSSSSSLLSSDFVDGIPVTTLNVNAVDVDFFRIDLQNLPNTLNHLFGKSSIYTYYADGLIKKGAKLVYSGRFDLNPKKNARESVILPIKNIKELQPSGIYIALMKRPGVYYEDYFMPATIFSVTDVGVITHKTKEGYEIFTQSLVNGAMLPNVNIKLLDESGKILTEKQTNVRGYLKLPYTAGGEKPKALIAQSGEKISFISLNIGALDLAEFSLSGAQNFDKTLFAFGPRDLYRSGEKVFVNAILRDSDGKAITEQPLKVDIIQADNKIARSFTWQGKEGFYQYSFELPENAPTGTWKLKFDLGDNSERFYYFRVEDFMPEKMAIEVNASETPLLKTQNVVFNVYGKYLYGASAGGNKLIGNTYSRALRNALSSLSGFYFGSVRENDLDREFGSIDTTLDENGTAKIEISNSYSSIGSPINVLFEASLMESGGRPVTRTFTQAVWPNTELPAIKPNFGKKEIYNYKTNRYESEFSVDDNSKAEFEIVFTNKDGERLAKNNLRVTLIKERRDYFWYYSDGDWKYNYHQKDISMESVDVSVAKGKSAVVGFNVEWGSYVVEVEDKDTGAISSVRFWAGYSWQDSSSGGGARPEQVKLKIDKPSYKAGDVAKVSVESPEGGGGYLLVESNKGILWWKNINVGKDGGTFDIPVSKEWTSHDIYISAVVIRGGSKNLHSTPKRALGMLHLPLFRDDRKIDINITLPAKIEPKQRLSVHLKANITQKQKGKKFTAILSAVDSGILNITDFKTPNPFNAFFAKRWFNVDIFDVYGNLIEGSGKSAALKFGGDTALSKAGKKPVTKILLVALQSEPVTLDENGEADVSVVIPDFNGELRFMTQVWSEEDYGSAEVKAVVASPLIAELNHPRFLAGGDKSTLTLDLNNLSGLEQKLKVSIKTTGLLYFEGKEEQQISIADKQKKVIYIPISAKSGFGNGDVLINVSGIADESGKKAAIERKWTIGVRAPYPAESFAFFKTLEKNAVIKSGEFEKGYNKLDERTIEARISLTAVPPLGLSEAVRDLFAYPYGCVEQTTSGVYPFIYTSSEQLRSLGINTSSDEERRKNVEKGIERLLGMQKPNGAFGFWDSESSEAYWASVYVTDFLLRAKEQGYYVPQNALQNAIGRLQYYLNTGSFSDEYSDSPSYTEFAIKSYAAFVLAKEQKASLGNLRRLYDAADNRQSSLATLQLGIALKLMGDNERSGELFKQAIAFSAENDTARRWYGDYGSPLRNRALILSLLYEYDLLPNERTKILLSLSEQIKTQRYFSTQERNAIFLAGRHFINSNEPDWEAVIDAKGKKESIKDVKKAFVRNLDFTALDAIQSIKNTGEQTLFASVDIIGYPKSAPKPSSNNVNITRSYYTLEGKSTTLGELKSGDLIIVVLNVTTSLNRLPDALVVDLLPAGLELENQNLGHSSVSLQNSEAMSTNQELIKQAASTTIIHQEFRDDRYIAAIDVGKYNPATLVYLARAVSPGTYAVPPPYVESMYNPSYFSIGSSVSKLTVK
ncbi:MAG: alpha-2-macroglobulin family protein [Campylobacteraceae bacterium]|jgi:uncharacterized protein YfaS (alpha-2-macroglobulin family)|nr:alpha-2-macroglobulin family protein [Campylobacteraceae bacterium]